MPRAGMASGTPGHPDATRRVAAICDPRCRTRGVGEHAPHCVRLTSGPCLRPLVSASADGPLAAPWKPCRCPGGVSCRPFWPPVRGSRAFQWRRAINVHHRAHASRRLRSRRPPSSLPPVGASMPAARGPRRACRRGVARPAALWVAHVPSCCRIRHLIVSRRCSYGFPVQHAQRVIARITPSTARQSASAR